MTVISSRSRRSAAAIGSVGLLTLVAAFGGAAFGGAAAAAGRGPGAARTPRAGRASRGGIKGDPQPERAPFGLGKAAGTAGSVAVESDGSLVLAYVVPTATGEIRVCVLARGGSACTHTNTLQPLSPDDIEGQPQVFAPSPGHVVVLVGAGVTHGDLLFTSTDGGKTFGSPAVVTNELEVDAAELVGGTMIWSESGDSDGVKVGSYPVAPAGSPVAGVAALSSQEGTTAVGTYKGGVLVAGDVDGDSGPTTIRFAASGKDVSDAGSYVSAGSVSGQYIIGMSGDALVTQQSGGAEAVELRFFNGTSFGAAHVVPGSKGGGPEWFAMAKDPGGVTHVFTETDRTTPLYELEEYSTTNGTTWTGPTALGDATDDTYFAAGLDRAGTGIVLGTAPARAYPILAAQSVSFSLKKASLRKGQTTTGHGQGHAAAPGRTVQLQLERSGKWFTVATTKEKAGGAFSFTIKGQTVGTSHYRAVAADHAGYVQFGYSSSRALTVKK